MLNTSDARQKQYWEADPKYRHVDHPVVTAFARQRLDYLSTWLDLSSIESALDVGCGDGFSTVFMRERIARVWGTDRSASMLSRNPMRGLGQIARADMMVLPFANGTVDLVYCWEVLHHVSDPDRAVTEMARVARRYVLIAEPNPKNLLQFAYAIVDREHRWVLKFSLDYMTGLLENAGLRVMHASSGGFILPNRTPRWFLPILKRMRYQSPRGISNWVLGVKSDHSECTNERE
jgi:ubiquinone/menaquinone biosynthesis C-methylase UbiE